MAQLLVTIEDAWYQNIASVRNYYESQFESKILQHATNIFDNFYVLECKYDITSKNDKTQKYKPDFLLISKTYKNWYIVEVELCGKNLTHTKKQLRCFSNPDYDTQKLTEYLIKKNSLILLDEQKLYNLLLNNTPKVLVIYDDYCNTILENLKNEFDDLKFCVIETYRTKNHPSESYRISGEYPYEISGVSHIDSDDNMNYEILRGSLLANYDNNTELEIDYYFKTIKAKLIKVKNRVFLNIPNSPLPPDANFQLEIDINNKLIIKKI